MARKLIWSIQAAIQWQDIKVHRLNQLCRFPNLGFRHRAKGIHSIRFKSLRIYYEIRQDAVIILGIWHTRRNPDDLPGGEIQQEGRLLNRRMGAYPIRTAFTDFSQCSSLYS